MAELVFTFIVAGLILLGALSGRWWTLLAALPVGVVMGLLSNPEEVSKLYCGVAWGSLAVFSLGAGVTLGKVTRRVRPRSSPPARPGGP
jgi:hypothetical protein